MGQLLRETPAPKDIGDPGNFKDYRHAWLGTLGQAHVSTGKPAETGRSLRFV